MFPISHTTMGNLQYRSTVWMCGQLCQDSDIPQKPCPPIPLFLFMVNQQMSWGRYAIYITWLHRHFPTHGWRVFCYLKTHHSTSMYSLPYLAGQFVLYHVVKSIHAVCRSCTTRFSRRHCEICQSTQDSSISSQRTTATTSELYPA